MENLIIIMIIAIFAFFGIRNTVKHFKHESACCGGGNYKKAKKKHIKNITFTKTIIAVDISCEHCKNALESAFALLDGVSAKVNVKKKSLSVYADHELSNEQIFEIVKKAGYTPKETK